VLLSNVIMQALTAEGAASSLLFPLYTDVGAVFTGTRIKVKGEEYNVYVMVIDVGIAEHLPDGTYVLGRFSSEDEYFALVSQNLKIVEPVKWPCGIYYAPLSQGYWYVSHYEFIDSRKVKTLTPLGFINTGLKRRLDF